MLTMTSRLILIGVILLVLLFLGCGRSSRDLSDQQWLDLQADMQSERAEVGQQRDQLEADRREWDARQRSEPVVAAAISSGALLICCVLPLLLMTLLIWPRKPEPADEAVSDLLIDDAVNRAGLYSDDPRRLGPLSSQQRLATRDPSSS